MTRCLSPVPPLAPIEARTDTTCATVDVGDQIPVEPSNCACPDTVLYRPIGNYEFSYDRFWNVGAASVLVQKQYIVALVVNRNGFQYDQIFIHRVGECEQVRLWRMEVQVRNLAGTQRIALVDYNALGQISAVHFDVDVSSIFGDGQEHWVVIVSDNGTVGDHTKTKVYVDSQLIGEQSRTFQNLSDFVQLAVSGNVDGEALPFCYWQYQQTIEDCLSSGNYNGTGGCEILDQDNSLRWDRVATDLNLSLHQEDRVVVPKVGVTTSRVAYLTHPKMSGRVYWEVDTSTGGVCKQDDNSAYGCAEWGLVLGGDMPGMVEGSWGLTNDGDRLFADGVQIGTALVRGRQCFCYDVQERRLWIGWKDTPSNPGVRVWQGGGEPGAGATSYVLFPVVRDLRIVFRFNEDLGAAFVVSSARSCHFPAPASFGYLT